MRVSRRRKSRSIAIPEITLTPLIDTALTLLIIFMVTAPMMQHNIRLNLPRGNSKEVVSQPEYVLTVTKEGQYFFNNTQLERDQVVAAVTKALAGRDTEPVYIRADREIPYGDVIVLVEEIKKAGVRTVALSVEKQG